MKTSIAAITAATALAVPGAALARPADTAPTVPKVANAQANASRIIEPPNKGIVETTSGSPAAGRTLEPPNRGQAQYRPAAIAAATGTASRAAGSPSATGGDGLDTFAVVLIAAGAAAAAAGTGFAAGRMRRPHGLAG